MNSCARLFVYGTLKRNRPNHSVLENQEPKLRFLENGITIDKYPLVIASTYKIPYLLNKPGTGKLSATSVLLTGKVIFHCSMQRIKGELYEIKDENLIIFDKLEGHPNYYIRQIIKVQNEITGNILEAWAYVFPNFNPKLLDNELLSSYEEEHTDGYVKQKDRDPNKLRPSGLKL